VGNDVPLQLAHRIKPRVVITMMSQIDGLDPKDRSQISKLEICLPSSLPFLSACGNPFAKPRCLPETPIDTQPPPTLQTFLQRKSRINFQSRQDRK
jgi:hypothetical protein